MSGCFFENAIILFEFFRNLYKKGVNLVEKSAITLKKEIIGRVERTNGVNWEVLCERKVRGKTVYVLDSLLQCRN